MTAKKLGLDYHGVIDTYTEIFKRMAKAWVDRGREVHLITGTSLTREKLAEIRAFGVLFTHQFSIVDYHTEIGTNIRYDQNGRPWIDDDLWDMSKAQYCKANRIYMHFDDSPIYGQHFELGLHGTTYIQVTDDLMRVITSRLRQHDEMEALGLNVPF